MKSFLQRKKIVIGDPQPTPFSSSNNTYQDGTTPCFCDVDGKLWAISGHTHMGEIAMFCGTTIEDMQKLYAIETKFETGDAGRAFNGVRYPEDVLPRGSIWPFGLYICPNTHRFFVFFHNETGWNAPKTGYDSFGICEIPKYDSDFRHIGLMHSDDEGRTWYFDRWIVSSETVCFSELYNPSDSPVLGQCVTDVCLGAGDFSLFVPDGEYIYLVYNVVHVDVRNGKWLACDVGMARSRKRQDGVMGDFVKFYDGAFSEAGNFGKETPIVKALWHPSIVYLREEKLYMLSGSPVCCGNVLDPAHPERLINRVVELRFSENLLDWSEPIRLEKDGKAFGAHYCSFYSAERERSAAVSGNKLVLQLCGNGLDVIGYKVDFIDKD